MDIFSNLGRVILLSSLLGFTECEVCTTQICEYNFDVFWAQTMTYYEPRDRERAFMVALNGTELQIRENAVKEGAAEIGQTVPSDDVITGDGVRRDVIVINGQYPGPMIEVMEDAQVVVHVRNLLYSESITIHWHGIHQHKTPFMDGAFQITQCAITPGQTFTYRFKASPEGTHWYHTHVLFQQIDGIVGMFVVHKKPPQPVTSFHPVALTDWYHDYSSTIGQLSDFSSPERRLGSGGDVYMGGSHTDSGPDNSQVSTLKFHSIIVNGRGRFDPSELLPLEEFTVTSGEARLFRMVSMAIEFTFEVSVDNHKLTITATDGIPVVPFTVDSIIISRGERVDFELDAEQIPGRYWMRVRTMRHAYGFNSQPDSIIQEGKAIISYENIIESGEPITEAKVCATNDPCLAFGCPWKGYADSLNKLCVGIEGSHSVDLNDDYYGLKEDPEDVLEYFLNPGFAFVGSSMNLRTFVHPEEPLLGRKSDEVETRCLDEECEDGCTCTNIMNLPVNRTIQLVIANQVGSQGLFQAHHSMHLHGYNFAVVKVGYPSYNETTGFRMSATEDVQCDDSRCGKMSWARDVKEEFNLVNPPIRDTLVIPALGYLVIRFKSWNPGYWAFHCHSVSHHVEGMAMVVNVGEEHHPPIPDNMQRCAKFDFTEEQYDEYMKEAWNDEKDIEPTKIELTDGQMAGICIGCSVAGVILGIVGVSLCNKFRK